jgi:magnesium-transporting ATPase (P-type)
MRTSSFRREALTGNPVAWLVVGVLLLLQLLFVYVPALNSWFGSAPVGPGGWVLPIVFGVAILLVVEAGKVALRGVERGAS